MQLASRSGSTLGFLLVLCCAVQSSAVSPVDEPGQVTPGQVTPGQDATLSGVLDQLWTSIGGVVRAVSGSVAAQLDGRLAEVEARLATQVGGLYSQLETTRTELEAQNSQLEAQTSNLTQQLDGVKTDLSAQNAELSAQTVALAGRLDRVGSELNAVRTQLRQPPPVVRDCSDLPADAPSGVHLLQPGLYRLVPAYCDQETDGGNWTVFQRRADVKPRRDFFLGWEAYKWGFGELDAEFWWGLEHLWLTTSLLDRRYELRIDMEDFEGERRHAVYQGFRIASEADGYRLTAVNYTGDANDSLSGHSGHRFSTKDRVQDTNSGNCAKSYSGAWWYTKCHNSNLNGLYLAGKHDSYANGVDWQAWKGYHYSLKTVTMKMRPTSKL